jgi:carbon-monoxide dehydrogenase iron sulfur subunit
MKRVYAREAVCMGCRLCEVHCIVRHTPHRNILKAFRGGRKPVPAVRVQEEGPLSFAMQCRHCEDPACLSACITGAMRLDDRGVVVVKHESCIGCWTCVLACPYGAIERDEENRRSVKCDLCPGDETPACVAMCPNGALVFAAAPTDDLRPAASAPLPETTNLVALAAASIGGTES